jgi:very-short-patch-repair endonuclease
LRLLLIDAGLPRPQTQIPVPGVDSLPIAYLDLGWPESMVAVEYDGDQHRTDRRQYVKDIKRTEMLEQLGWIIVRVVAEDRAEGIVDRVRAALAKSRVKQRL